MLSIKVITYLILLPQVVHHHNSDYVPAHAAPKPSVRLWTIVAGVLEPRDGIH